MADDELLSDAESRSTGDTGQWSIVTQSLVNPAVHGDYDSCPVDVTGFRPPSATAARH